MLNTVLLMGLILTVVGKVVGIAFAAKTENATSWPFIVLVTAGYAMVICAGLAGGSVSF